MFNTGQVTLPKKWRERYKTNKFMARSEGNTLVIEPILPLPESLKDENIEIYDEGHGIRFQKGLGSEAIEYLKQQLSS